MVGPPYSSFHLFCMVEMCRQSFFMSCELTTGNYQERFFPIEHPLCATTVGRMGRSGKGVGEMKKAATKIANRTGDAYASSSVGCGEEMRITSGETPAPLVEAVLPLLKKQSATASATEMERFVQFLGRSIRQRDVVSRQWAKITDKRDIVWLIHESLQNRQADEAVWRCFVAAHLGRTSARGQAQIESAGRFLCAFLERPFWTWEKVAAAPDALEEWLHECPDDLATLAFGNHRKYESQKPGLIWSVMDSFITLAKQYESPSQLIASHASEDCDPFNELYRRLRPIRRFGRTGRFDFLVLLLDVGLIADEPTSSYLKGATGPLKGARKLWGPKTPTELDQAAAELAMQIGVSPIILEDALCNWQK